jgi:transposase
MTARKKGIKKTKTGRNAPKTDTQPPETTEFDWQWWTRAAKNREALVRLALAANQHPTAIAKHCGFTRNAVYYYKSLMANPPSEKKRSRRRSDTQKRIFARRSLVRVLAKKTVKAPGDPEGTRVKLYSSAMKIAAVLQVKHNIVVTSRTVEKDLKAMGLVAKVRPKQPLLTASKKEKRVEFAKSELPSSELLLFSDECYFGATYGGRWEWVEKGEEPLPIQLAKFDLKVMIFGIIGVGIKAFLVYPFGSVINKEKYIECLGETLKPIVDKYPARHFMQDGAPAHTARDTKKYLKSLGVPLLNWPPSSPDLNPIENLWASMKHQAGYYCPVNNKNEENARKMADRVRKVIANIKQSYIDSLVRSFERRLQLCVMLDGNYTQTARAKKLSRELNKEQRRTP